MLTVRKLGFKQASSYYAKDNYYTKEQGEYFGNLKDELGLTDLTHDSFQNLLKGINPTTGERLTPSKENKKGNVPAIDFTMSPSKSISIAYEIALERGDIKLANQILEMHDNAVNSTLNHIEQNHIKSRVQKNGKRTVKTTGNMITAKFQHDSNRALQAQLHTHCVTMNITKINGKFRALDASKLFAKKNKIVKNLGQFYRENLRQNLENAGFKLRDKDIENSFFELEGISDEAIKSQSSRSIKIKAKIKELKKKHPDLSDSQISMRAFFDTRDKKQDLDNVDRDLIRTKNVEEISKHLDCDKLLSDLNSVKTVDQQLEIQTPVITKKDKIKDIDIETLAYQTSKEIKNKYHRTVDNVTNLVAVKLNKETKSKPKKLDIQTLYKEVKKSQEKQQKILHTMNDVLIVNLEQTKLNTQKMFSSHKVDELKLVNININELKNNIEENIENGKGSHRVRSFTRAYKESTRTAEAISSNVRDVRDAHREINPTRKGGERGTGVEFERSNDDSNRNTTDYSREVIVTIDDIKLAEKGAKQQKTKENKNNKDKEL